MSDDHFEIKMLSGGLALARKKKVSYVSFATKSYGTYIPVAGTEYARYKKCTIGVNTCPRTDLPFAFFVKLAMDSEAATQLTLDTAEMWHATFKDNMSLIQFLKKTLG